MKCEVAKQNIDQYFKEGFGELDPETRQHLISCSDCNMYFTTHNKAKELVTRIRDFEPVLSDPSGLTDDIMMALSDSATVPEADKKIKASAIFQSAIFRRSLSAAAIILFALFGFEQYLVLDKINKLEQQNQTITAEYGIHANIRMYYSPETKFLSKYNHVIRNKNAFLNKVNTLSKY